MGDFMKKMKLIWKILIGLLAAFLLWNLVWFGYTHLKYAPYKEAVGYDEQRKKWYFRDEDDYVFGVGSPSYLSFTGNLSITQTWNISNDGKILNESICDMIIWPLMNGEYEYGICISEITEDGEGMLTNEFILDSKMQPIEVLTDEQQKLLDENAEQIAEIFQKAKKMWPELPIIDG